MQTGINLKVDGDLSSKRACQLKVVIFFGHVFKLFDNYSFTHSLLSAHSVKDTLHC